MKMAQAADALGLLDLAVWFLEQASQPSANNSRVNRALARLYEKRGNFTQAIALWEMVRKANPTDVEAQGNAKNLAASDTIARGRYEEVLHSASSGDSGESAVEEHEEPDPEDEEEEESPAAAHVLGERVGREAAPIQARIKANP